jgi:hypothetical protein
MHVVHVVLERIESRFDGVGHLLLDSLCRRRACWDFRCRERVSVDECVPRGSSFDLAKAYKIATLEVPVPMLELPERRVWRPCMEDVAHFVKSVHVQLADKRRDVGMLEI